MGTTNWLKQTGKPAFPDIEWSRPQSKQSSGKLLIIGGNAFSASAPAKCYEIALKNGIGYAKVILPDRLKHVTGTLPDLYFAPSNKSGGFKKSALAEWLDLANWSDGVIFAGDIGRNSETSQTIELFLEKYEGPTTITKDCLDQFTQNPKLLLNRTNTLIVANIGQIQKMWPKAIPEIPVPAISKSLELNVSSISGICSKFGCNIITKHDSSLIIGNNDKVATTPNNQESWQLESATKSTIWLIQNKTKVFEALVSANFIE